MTNKKNYIIYFFLGTEAELIKIFTVIKALEKEGYDVRLITSGQNKVSKSRVLKETNGGRIYMNINETQIKQTPIGLLGWFFKTYGMAKNRLGKEFKNIDKSKSLFIVHGDTITTIMGARIAKKLGMKVVHIEAGLRSFNYFSPFPEEIDRIITSWYADIHFPPCQEGVTNLKKAKGIKINTKANPVYDSYVYSKSVPLLNKELKKVLERPYFVFVVHRNENLANEPLMKALVERVIKTAKPDLKCAFIMHGPTETTLKKLNLIKTINKNQNIYLMPRLDYFDFMKLADHSTFVITDGGSNQQEFYFIGTPCILMRTATEQPEGLGENIILSKNDLNVLDGFINHYKDYQRKPFVPKNSPTEIIVRTINNEFGY